MANARQKLERARRQAEVARLYLLGLRPAEIAGRLDCSPRTVQQDLQQIRKDWEARARLAHGELVAEQMSRIDSIEHEARQAWTETGNCRFLRVALDCVKQRRELLGLDRPAKLEVTAPAPVRPEDFTDQQLAEIIARAERPGSQLPGDAA